MRQSLRCVTSHQRGFTLLEIIVAMTLFFAVSGILASGVVQAMRLSESAATQTTISRDDALRLNWWRESVGLSVANGELKDKTFQGEPRRLRGFTLAQQDASDNASGQYEWALTFSPETGKTALAYVKPPLANASLDGSTMLTVTQWDGAVGGFRYLDGSGNWSDTWPARGIATLDLPRSTAARTHGAPAAAKALLPMAVEMTIGTPSGGTSVVVVAIQDRSPPPPTLREMLQ